MVKVTIRKNMWGIKMKSSLDTELKLILNVERNLRKQATFPENEHIKDVLIVLADDLSKSESCNRAEIIGGDFAYSPHN